ncbi:hypothetical protein PCE1_003659 [Barthelona sp. PCE]
MSSKLVPVEKSDLLLGNRYVFAYNVQDSITCFEGYLYASNGQYFILGDKPVRKTYPKLHLLRSRGIVLMLCREDDILTDSQLTTFNINDQKLAAHLDKQRYLRELEDECARLNQDSKLVELFHHLCMFWTDDMFTLNPQTGTITDPDGRTISQPWRSIEPNQPRIQKSIDNFWKGSNAPSAQFLPPKSGELLMEIQPFLQQIRSGSAPRRSKKKRNRRK